MPDKDTDKLDPQKPVTVHDLVAMLSGGKGKPMGAQGIMQMVLTVAFVLLGTGAGQSFFGVSKDQFTQEMQSLKQQNNDLLREVGGMKERIVRLETKMDK